MNCLVILFCRIVSFELKIPMLAMTLLFRFSCVTRLVPQLQSVYTITFDYRVAPHPHFIISQFSLQPARMTRLVPVIPDGGWGWVVVVGSFLVHVLADGFVYSFGVLVEELVEVCKGVVCRWW